MTEQITVDIAFALPEEQTIMPLTLPTGSTVQDAVNASNLLQHYAHYIDLENLSVGIFGQKVTLDTKLTHADRIEIYRPLTADPKDIRRQKAQNTTKQKRNQSK